MKGFWWFLVGLSFFLLTLLFVIVLMSRTEVCEAAMANVSFASSIVSIVLAVISIFISMNASTETDRNLGSMRDIDRKLSESIADLRAIKSDTEHTRRQVEKLFEKGNRVDEVLEAESGLKRGRSFMMTSKDGVMESVSYEDIEREVFEKISSTFGFRIKRNYKLRGIPNMLFDGYSRYEGEDYVFELKLVKSKDQAIYGFKRYLAFLSEGVKRLGITLSVVIVAVCTDNNKDEVLEKLTSGLFFPDLNLSVLSYNLSEFKKDK